MSEYLAFDPRDPEQRLEDPTSWKATVNPALLVADQAIQMLGKDPRDVDWQAIARAADYCDETVAIGDELRRGARETGP